MSYKVDCLVRFIFGGRQELYRSDTKIFLFVKDFKGAEDCSGRSHQLTVMAK